MSVLSASYQPSSHRPYPFPQVILLAEGRLIFQGRPLDAAPAFSSLGLPCPEGMSTADHMLMSVGSPELLESLMLALGKRESGCVTVGDDPEQQERRQTVDKAESPSSGGALPAGNNPAYALAAFRKPGVLLWCSAVPLLRNPALLLMHYLGAAAMGLLVGFVFFKIQVETTAGERLRRSIMQVLVVAPHLLEAVFDGL